MKIRPAQVVENREIARGSRWLHLKPMDGEALAYQPGNVLSLFVSSLRHAYTVTQCDGKTFSLIYRVIPEGRMTPVMEMLKPGDEAGFEGVHHNPIHLEISQDPRAIVGISTGTGIGPLYGFAAKALKEKLFKAPITLYAGYREEKDLCLREELDTLAAGHPNFKWAASLSRPGADWKGLKGRVTESVPPLLKDLQETHFHLVGNQAMLMDFYEALARAGHPEARRSSETYFNWNADFEEATVLKMLESIGSSKSN